MARAAGDHRRRVCHPALELIEAALGDADAAGVPVVDEDGRALGLEVVVGREAADVPPVAHRPERQHRDHRVLGRVQGSEQNLIGHAGKAGMPFGRRRKRRLRHLVELCQLFRLRHEPDRLGRKGRLRQLERHDLDSLLRADRLALVADHLLGHLDLAEDER